MRVDKARASNALRETLISRKGTRVDPGGAVNNTDIAKNWDFKHMSGSTCSLLIFTSTVVAFRYIVTSWFVFCDVIVCNV